MRAGTRNYYPQITTVTRCGLAEAHALGQRQFGGVVDRVGGAPHVGLPRVGAGLPAAAGLLLAAERAADLGARRADVDVWDAAVGPVGRHEPLRFADVTCEDRRRKTLRHGIVQR